MTFDEIKTDVVVYGTASVAAVVELAALAEPATSDPASNATVSAAISTRPRFQRALLGR
jgi:hypothetical protein